MARPEWIEVGRISRAHGIHGEVRVLPSSDNPDRFSPGAVLHGRPERLGVAGPRLQEQVRLTIESLRGDEGFPIVAFQEVTDRTAAEALRGYILQVRSDDLPELDDDEYYPFDLVGLAVRDETGEERGAISDVVESPAHALLVVGLTVGGGATGGREVLVPFVNAAVPQVDLAEGFVVVESAFLR